MRSSLTLLLTLSLPSLLPAADPVIPADLLGCWKLEATSFKGGVFQPPDKTAWVVILDDGQFISKSPTGVIGGHIVVDPAASPPALDLNITHQSGNQRAWTNLSVYQVTGDELVIAKAMEGKNRPASLDPHVDIVVQRFRRAPQR